MNFVSVLVCICSMTVWCVECCGSLAWSVLKHYHLLISFNYRYCRFTDKLILLRFIHR
jgi:hypothetical protein